MNDFKYDLCGIFGIATYTQNNEANKFMSDPKIATTQ